MQTVWLTANYNDYRQDDNGALYLHNSIPERAIEHGFWFSSGESVKIDNDLILLAILKGESTPTWSTEPLAIEIY